MGTKMNIANNAARITSLAAGLLFMSGTATAWGMNNAVTVAYGTAAGQNLGWIVKALEERYYLARVNFSVSTNWTLPQLKNYCRQILPCYVDHFEAAAGMFDNYFQQGMNALPMLTGTGLCARLNMPTNYLDYTPPCYLSRVAQGVSGGGTNYPPGRTNWTTVDYGWEGLTGLVANLKWTKTMPAWCSQNGYVTNYYYEMTNTYGSGLSCETIYTEDGGDPTDAQIEMVVHGCPAFMGHGHDGWYSRDGGLQCEDVVLRDSCPAPDVIPNFLDHYFWWDLPRLNRSGIVSRPGKYYYHAGKVDYFMRLWIVQNTSFNPHQWTARLVDAPPDILAEDTFQIYGCDAKMRVELGLRNYTCQVNWYVRETATNWISTPVPNPNYYHAGNTMAAADQRIESDTFQSRGEMASVTMNYGCAHDQDYNAIAGNRLFYIWSRKKLIVTNEYLFIVDAGEAVVKWDVPGGLRFLNPP